MIFPRAFTLAALTCLTSASAQQVMVVDSTSRQLHRFSLFNGALLEQGFCDLNQGTGTTPVHPVKAIEVSGSIAVTDQGADVVHLWNMDGSAYLGELDPGFDDLRGGVRQFGSRLFLCNGGSGGAGYGEAIVEYDFSVGGVANSFSVPAPGDALVGFEGGAFVLHVTDIAAGEVRTYGLDGTPLGLAAGPPGLQDPGQLTFRNLGFLIAGTGSGGLHVLDESGSEVAFLDTAALGFPGPRGVYPLWNGNILFTNSAGVHIYDASSQTISTQLGGIQGEFISGYSGKGTCACFNQFCISEPNSSGLTAYILPVGSPVVTVNDLRLSAVNLPPETFGIFITSRNMGPPIVFTPGGGGLCLRSPIGRFNAPGQVLQTGPIGVGALEVDLTQMPTPNGFVAAQPGETWNFQCWFRDAHPGPISAFTAATDVTLQ